MGKNGHRKAMTPLQQSFVAVHRGDDTAAAREIGIVNNAKQRGHVMAKHPLVAAALERKRTAMIIESGKIVAKEVAVTKDKITSGILRTIARLEKCAELAASQADLPAQARAADSLVKAFDVLAVLTNNKISLSADLTRQFEGRSDADKEYFATNGYWPNLDTGEPGAAGPKSPGETSDKPN